MKKSMRGSPVIFCWVLGLGALSCGDDEADSCEAFVACGGDPVGVWRSQAACLPDDVVQDLAMDLPEACRRQVTIEQATASTTLTLREDGSYSEQGSLTVEWAMEFREDCISAVTLPGQDVSFETSAQFCAAFADTISGPDTPFTSSRCSTRQDGCSCSAEQVQAVNESGSYTIDGTSLVDSNGVSQGFCVRNDRLDVGGVQGMATEGAYVSYDRSE
jgi:hypothetical protein